MRFAQVAGLISVAVGLALTSVSANAASCIGACGTSTVADGVISLSPDGGSYNWLSTYGGEVLGGALKQLQTPNDSTDPATGSTYVTDTFKALAGDMLQFYFNYVSSDGGGFADYSWAELRNGNGTHVAWLMSARSNPPNPTVPGLGMPSAEATFMPGQVMMNPGGPIWSPLKADSGECFGTGCGSTGWIKAEYNIAEAGDYQIAFGVQNWVDGSFNSGLAFDGISLNSSRLSAGGGDNGEVSDVPLPAGFLLFGTALAGLAGARRKRR